MYSKSIHWKGPTLRVHPLWLIMWYLATGVAMFGEVSMLVVVDLMQTNTPYYKAQNDPFGGFVPLLFQCSCSNVFSLTLGDSGSLYTFTPDINMSPYVCAWGLYENMSAYIHCLCSVCLSVFTSRPHSRRLRPTSEAQKCEEMVTKDKTRHTQERNPPPPAPPQTSVVPVLLEAGGHWRAVSRVCQTFTTSPSLLPDSHGQSCYVTFDCTFLMKGWSCPCQCRTDIAFGSNCLFLCFPPAL